MLREQDQFDSLRERLKGMITGGDAIDPSDPDIAAKINETVKAARRYWDSMERSPDKTSLWSDLPCSDVNIMSTYWRLAVMAKAYCTEGSAFKDDPALLRDTLSALDWVYENWYNENTEEDGNWWFYEIGTPQAVIETVSMLYSRLTPTQVNNYMKPVNKFSPDPNTCVFNNGVAVGTNRIWKCHIVACYGILTKNAGEITSAIEALQPLFEYVTEGDGFYSDGSFIQHLQHPYNGGYGRGMIIFLYDLAYLLTDSPWKIAGPVSKIMYQWVYDSFEPLMYKGEMMHMTTGREISRQGSQNHIPGHSVIAAVIRGAQSAPDSDAFTFKRMAKYWIQNDTFASFYNTAGISLIPIAKHIMEDPGITPKEEHIQNRIYASMDRVVHRRPGFVFGISMSSSRIRNFESINNENLKGWYTGDGMTYLYNQDLGHYSGDFWPTVNPYRLPGTTVDTRTRSLGEGQSHTSTKNWVGGTNIFHLYGTAGMELKAYGSTLTARKSWFMFDDEIVCLGSGINSTDNQTIETIIENRRLNSNGSNTFRANNVEMPSFPGWQETMKEVSYAHLCGTEASGADIGYYFPGGAKVCGIREKRTGSWCDISTGSGNSNSPVSANYLCLWLDHGVNPVNECYSYVLLPNKTPSQVKHYAENPDIRILENSEAVQAVLETGLNITAANFWTDTPKKAGRVSCAKKASIMYWEGQNEFEIAFSDPTQANDGTIEIDIDRPAAADVFIDEGIEVIQYAPSLKLSIRVKLARGKTFRARFKAI